MARLFDKIPTVMKMIEKNTESRFSVWQVVFERIPAAGDTGCLELFTDIVVEIKDGHSSHLSLKTVQVCSPDILASPAADGAPGGAEKRAAPRAIARRLRSSARRGPAQRRTALASGPGSAAARAPARSRRSEPARCARPVRSLGT